MKQYAVIVHEALKESGINFVAYLPDDQIHDAQKLITEDKDFTTVGVTNEVKRWQRAPVLGWAVPSRPCLSPIPKGPGFCSSIGLVTHSYARLTCP